MNTMKTFRRIPRLLGWLGMAGAMVIGTAPAGADGPATTQPKKELSTVWQVQYQDADLGEVSGRAVIDWEHGTGAVFLENPLGQNPNVLQTVFVQTPSDANGGNAVVVLKGFSPMLNAVSPLTTTDAPNLHAPLQSAVKFEAKSGTGTPRVHPTDQPDAQQVTVRLALDEDGNMSGHWEYFADPQTERDARGVGRAGVFQWPGEGRGTPGRDAFVGFTSAEENWGVVKPTYIRSTVLFNVGAYPTAKDAGTPDKPTGNQIRYLMVVGAFLPLMPSDTGRWNAVGAITSADEHLSYKVIASTHDVNLPTEDHAFFLTGWNQVCKAEKTAHDAALLREQEAVLIEAHMTPGITPGPKRFTWGGMDVTWGLQFGDNTATLQFMREYPQIQGWTAAEVAYAPEVLRLELHTNVELPVDTIPIMVGQDKDSIVTVPATRVPGGDPKTYVTGRLVLAENAQDAAAAGGATLITVHPGDVLFAANDPYELTFSTPLVAAVRIAPAPASVNASWSKYLVRAAQADKLDFADIKDLRDMTQKVVDQKVHIIVYDLEKRKVEITLGQHAAMLMLRDLFLERMNREVENLDTVVLTDAATLGTGMLMAREVKRNPKGAYASLDCGTLNGKKCTLADLYDEDWRGFMYPGGLDDDETTWQLKQTRAAIAQLRDAAIKSRDTAKALADNDIEGLAKLTGLAFAPIVTVAQARVAFRDPVSGLWKLDTISYRYLDSIAALQNSLQAEADFASADNKVIVLAVGTIVALPAVISESIVASVIAFAGNCLMGDVQAISSLCDTYQNRKDLSFVLGVTPALGTAMYDEANTKNTSYWTNVKEIGADFALTAIGALDVGFKLNSFSQLQRGRMLLVELEGGLTGFNTLTRSDRALVKAYAAGLMKVQEGGKALKGIEQTAMDNWKGLQKNLEAAQPVMDANVKTLIAARKSMRVQVQEAENALKEARATALAGDEASMNKLERLKSKLDAVKGTQNVCGDLLRDATAAPETFALVTPESVAWLTSKEQALDVTSLEQMYAKYNQSWKKVKQAFKDGHVSKVEMFQVVKWRKQKVDSLLDEVIAEVKAETKSQNIWRKSLGSINLTSDYDISVYGDHAELVVAKFNERFRGLNKNLESGVVFDTNIYTNPVYKMFTRRALSGSGLALSSAQMDALQQVIYEQMAARKYAKNPAEWELHKARMLKTNDDATKSIMQYVLSEAEDAHIAAQEALHKKISGLPAEMKNGLAGAAHDYSAAHFCRGVVQPVPEVGDAGSHSQRLCREGRRAA